MKPALVGALSVLVATIASPRPAPASEWGSSAELGAGRTVSGDEVFKWAWDVGVAGHRRWRGRYYPGIFLEYRSAIDADPATSFWYADVGLRFFSVFGRFCGRVDFGWAFRHIALEQEGVSNTAGGPLLGLAAGVTILKTRRGSLDLLAASHITHANVDSFWITDIGLVVLWHFPS